LGDLGFTEGAALFVTVLLLHGVQGTLGFPDGSPNQRQGGERQEAEDEWRQFP
jgi:hypothetical protein